MVSFDLLPVPAADPIPGSAQGQVGWGWRQPGLVGVVLPMAGRWNQMVFMVSSNPSHSTSCDLLKSVLYSRLAPAQHE